MSGASVKPSERQVRDPGVHDDGVGGPFGTEREAIGGDHPGLRPGPRQVLARPRRQAGIDFDRRDVARGADDLGQDGAVVAGAGPDVDDMVSARQAELVVQGGPQAGLPVVEPAPFVDCHQDVVAEMGGGGILRRPVFLASHGAEDAPGSGSGEMLARHGGESLYHGGGADMGGVPQLFREPAPRRLNPLIRHPGLSDA